MRLGQVSGAADHPLQRRRRDVLRGGAIGSKSASHATACCRLGRAVLSRNSSRASRLPSCARHSSSRAGLGFWSVLSPQYAQDTFVYFPAHAVPHLRHHRLLRPRGYRAAYAHLASVVNLPGANGDAPVQGAAFPRLIVCDFAARELRHGSAARRQASRRPAWRPRWHYTGGTTARKCSTTGVAPPARNIAGCFEQLARDDVSRQGETAPTTSTRRQRVLAETSSTNALELLRAC